MIWGNDYDTSDGTGIRDFIHVVDLASGHLSVLSHLKQPGVLTVNLGTGSGSSVLEVVRTFEAVSGRPIPYVIGERRVGDVAICYADPTLAKETIGLDIKAIIDADVCRPLALADEKPEWLSWHLGLDGSRTLAARSLKSAASRPRQANCQNTIVDKLTTSVCTKVAAAPAQ